MVATEEIDAEFAWILDPILIGVRENLYTCKIETWWKMKTIMGLAMQELEEHSKTLETNIDWLTEKFVVYIEAIHHCRFITRDVLNYTVIKKKSIVKVYSTTKGTLSIKKEDHGASMSHQVITV